METKVLSVFVLIPPQGAEEDAIEQLAWSSVFELATRNGISGKTSDLQRSGPDFYQMTLADGRVVRGTFRQYEVEFEVEDVGTMGR